MATLGGVARGCARMPLAPLGRRGGACALARGLRRGRGAAAAPGRGLAPGLGGGARGGRRAEGRPAACAAVATPSLSSSVCAGGQLCEISLSLPWVEQEGQATTTTCEGSGLDDEDIASRLPAAGRFLHCWRWSEGHRVGRDSTWDSLRAAAPHERRASAPGRARRERRTPAASVGRPGGSPES